ncbi:hypothetical protein P8935_00945 [Telmatobacter sp. DSM 110680]|uniref:Uncharacterized protein n=1 Tax=Telmatobacter sp. DSM 110680 TaxID=3036704 RepID=A0AAU7DLE0_9BACT
MNSFDANWGFERTKSRNEYCPSESNSRRGNPRSGIVDKLAHALCFRALRSNQQHMTPNVIAMAQNRQLGFVAVGIFLQTLNAFFNQTTESGADLESFTRIRAGIFYGHCVLLFRARLRESGESPQVFSAIADVNDRK